MKMTSHKITDLLLGNGMQILELMQSSKQANHMLIKCCHYILTCVVGVKGERWGGRAGMEGGGFFLTFLTSPTPPSLFTPAMQAII